MKTSLTTFEHALRDQLLSLIYDQWAKLGAPFAVTAVPQATEVIDPEALVWCSLEFVPTEPRLFETVVHWLDANDDFVLRPRIKKRIDADRVRAHIWNSLDSKYAIDGPILQDVDFQDLTSPDDAKVFLQKLQQRIARHRSSSSRLGKAATGSSTALIRARDILGGDTRHFLLVYLLANRQGGKLREVQKWSGYTYRSVFNAARRWQAARIAVNEHGYCHLVDDEPWRLLLQIRSERLIVVDWFNVFESLITLHRVLAKAHRKGLPTESPVIAAHLRDAYRNVSTSLLHGSPDDAPSVTSLLDVFPDVAQIRVNV